MTSCNCVLFFAAKNGHTFWIQCRKIEFQKCFLGKQIYFHLKFMCYALAAHNFVTIINHNKLVCLLSCCFKQLAYSVWNLNNKSKNCFVWCYCFGLKTFDNPFILNWINLAAKWYAFWTICGIIFFFSIFNAFLTICVSRSNP